MKLTLTQDRKYYTDGSNYFYSMSGHTGFIKQAVTQVLGVRLSGQNRPSGQLGLSNPPISILFEDGPSEEKEADLWRAYWGQVEAAAAQRKANAGKTKPVPSPKSPRPVKAPKLLTKWMIRGTEQYDTLPEHVIETTGSERAKEMYEDWYDANHDHRLGYAGLFLKASKVKA